MVGMLCNTFITKAYNNKEQYADIEDLVLSERIEEI